MAFAVAFAPEGAVFEGINAQLSKWWKKGFEDCEPPSDLRPLLLPKEHNPRSKKLAVFAIDGSSPKVLIESNLKDGYASLLHMLAAALGDSKLVKIRSKPVGTDEWPIEEFDLMKEAAICGTCGWHWIPAAGNTVKQATLSHSRSPS